jgi:hypothetical protein
MTTKELAKRVMDLEARVSDLEGKVIFDGDDAALDHPEWDRIVSGAPSGLTITAADKSFTPKQIVCDCQPLA